MQCELNQSYSTIDNSIISESNNCMNSFENKTSEEIINILNLFIEKSKELPNYSQKLKKQEKSIFNAKKIPKISLKEYLERIKFYTEIENNTLIVAYLYIMKLIKKENFVLGINNVYRLLLGATVLAKKVLEDIKLDNSYYCAIGGISNGELNMIEYSLFTRIDFDVNLKIEELNKVYEEIFKGLPQSRLDEIFKEKDINNNNINLNIINNENIKKEDIKNKDINNKES